MKKIVAVTLFMVGLSVPSWAALQTITLSVPGMTCVVCPFTVKRALSRVDGVIDASANLAKKEATVTFDDMKTTAAGLTQATANSGYPSTVKGSVNIPAGSPVESVFTTGRGSNGSGFGTYLPFLAIFIILVLTIGTLKLKLASSACRRNNSTGEPS